MTFKKTVKKDLINTQISLKQELKDLCKLASKFYGGFTIKVLKQQKEICLNSLKELDERISTLQKKCLNRSGDDVPLSTLGYYILCLQGKARSYESSITFLDDLMASIKRIKAEIKKTKKNIDSKTLKKTTKENLLVVKTLTNFQLRKKLKDLLRGSRKCFHGLSSVKSLKQEKELLLSTLEEFEDRISSLEEEEHLHENSKDKQDENIIDMESITSLEDQAVYIESKIKDLDYLIISIKRIKRENNRRKKNNAYDL